MNERDPMSRPSDEELLELALAALRGEASAQRTLAALEPTRAAEAMELASFATHLRGVLRAEEAATTLAAATRQREVVSRVLARTTREDLSRWGDLGLTVSFVAARLRASGALRLAAASLLLHLLALPVVAWIVWSAPEDAPRIWFLPDPVEVVPPFDEPAPEPVPSVVMPPVDEVPGFDGSPRELDPALYAQNSLRWARWTLQAGFELELTAPVAGASELERLLHLRATRAHAAAAGAALPGISALPTATGDDAVVRALRAEAALDAVMLSHGVAPAELEGALLALLPEPADVPAPGSSEAAAWRLEASALARAEAYRVLPDAAAERLAVARGALSAPDRLVRRGNEAWLVAPFDREWREVLVQAAEGRLAPETARALLGPR